MTDKPILEYDVSAERIDAHGSIAICKRAELRLDADPAGRGDAFNPAELLLAAVAPKLGFQLDGVQVRIHGKRQDGPPKIVGITYELVVDTQEPDRRLELLHQNVRKYGTISNTVAAATTLSGTIRRAKPAGATLVANTA